jgi:16S rRNA (guanine966-N2)-methyltransferase
MTRAAWPATAGQEAHILRIIAGRHKGRAIAAPEGDQTRPTSDRARQAIFDIIAHAPWSPGLAGTRVIDLFAGSGALGLEALSRGAAFCLFVETDEAARGAVRRNIEALNLFGETRLHRRDATALGMRPASAGPPFDLAFLDPPYNAGLAAPAIQALDAGGWLAPAALVVLERSALEARPDLPDYEILDERLWGAAQVLFARAAGRPPAPPP